MIRPWAIARLPPSRCMLGLGTKGLAQPPPLRLGPWGPDFALSHPSILQLGLRALALPPPTFACQDWSLGAWDCPPLTRIDPWRPGINSSCSSLPVLGSRGLVMPPPNCSHWNWALGPSATSSQPSYMLGLGLEPGTTPAWICFLGSSGRSNTQGCDSPLVWKFGDGGVVPMPCRLDDMGLQAECGPQVGG